MCGQNEPLISVVIPIYNKQNYIGRTIESVLNQKFSNFEIIAVDDGSSDASIEKVKTFNDPRLRLIQRENGGDGAARNTGILEAKGQVIAFLDGDDQWMPEFLSEIYKLQEEFPVAGMYASGLRLKYSASFWIDFYVEPGAESGSRFLIEDYFTLALQRSFITSSNVAIKRSVFNEIGGFYEQIGASCDRDMWARVAMKYDIAYSKRILSTYNCEYSEGRVSQTKRKVPPAPAMSKTVAKLIEERGLQAVDEKLLDLVNIQWLDRVDKAIKSGNLHESLNILSNHIHPTKYVSNKCLWFKILIRLFPLSIIQLIRKIQKSRLYQPYRNTFKSNRYPRIVQRINNQLQY